MDNKYVSLSKLSVFLSEIKKWVNSVFSQDYAQEIIDQVYPIGSIFMSVSSINPKILFGGEWEQIKDAFLLASGDVYLAGEIGGESEHVLTLNEMPTHNHKVKTDINNEPYNITWEPWTEWTTGYTQVADETSSAPNGTTYCGGNEAHNNMPPYLSVYVWKRTE